MPAVVRTCCMCSSVKEVLWLSATKRTTRNHLLWVVITVCGFGYIFLASELLVYPPRQNLSFVKRMILSHIVQLQCAQAIVPLRHSFSPHGPPLPEPCHRLRLWYRQKGGNTMAVMANPAVELMSICKRSFL